MSIETNKQNLRRIFDEGFSNGQLDVIDECLAPDAVDRHPFEDGEPDFRTHLKNNITRLRAALPDLHAVVEDTVGEGDRVAARVVMTGTHTGAPIFGIAAAGRRAEVEQFHIVEFDELGRGARHWANVGIDQFVSQLSGAASQG